MAEIPRRSRKCFLISAVLREAIAAVLVHPGGYWHILKLPHSKSGSFGLRSRYVSKWFIRISWDSIRRSPSGPTSTWRPAVAKGVAHPQNVLQVDHYQVCLSHNNPMLKKKRFTLSLPPPFGKPEKKTRITKVQRVRDIGKVKEQLKPHPQQIDDRRVKARVLHHFIDLCTYYTWM